MNVQIKIFCFLNGEFIKNNFDFKISDKATFKEFFYQLRNNKKINSNFEKELNKNDSQLMILLNGQRVEASDGNTYIQDGDKISILSPMAGG